MAERVAEIRVHRYVRTRRVEVYDLDEAIEKARAAFAELGNLADEVEVRIVAGTEPVPWTLAHRRTWHLDVDANIDDRAEEPDRG